MKYGLLASLNEGHSIEITQATIFSLVLQIVLALAYYDSNLGHGWGEVKTRDLNSGPIAE